MSEDTIDGGRLAAIARAVHRPADRGGPSGTRQELQSVETREQPAVLPGGATSPEVAPAKDKPKRRRADYRKTAVATRRILIGVGRPLRNSEIHARLPAELRDQIDPNKLFRILGASRRAGLISTSEGWWVRKLWLVKSDKEWRRKLSGSSLAKVRRKLKRACDTALDSLRTSGTAKGADELLAEAGDIFLDRDKFIRTLWNRAQRDPRLHRLADGRYEWMPARKACCASGP